MERVLLVDDDVGLCELLEEYLGPEGFQVDIAHDGKTGREKACEGDYDLIVLDVMLPGENGFEVLRQIRARRDLPVVMLTARGDEVDRIVGLEMGADDYLPKPFNPRELVARIRAVLRRTRQEGRDEGLPKAARTIKVGDIEMDTGTCVVLRSGKEITLTSVEFRLLEIFLRKAGQLVSREELMQGVLGRSPSPFDRSIDVHVSKLRKKLGYKVAGIERIKAIRSAGYLYALTGVSELKSTD
jgi:two-component system, OmpR family, response regulator CpxR